MALRAIQGRLTINPLAIWLFNSQQNLDFQISNLLVRNPAPQEDERGYVGCVDSVAHRAPKQLTSGVEEAISAFPSVHFPLHGLPRAGEDYVVASLESGESDVQSGGPSQHHDRVRYE